MKNTRSDLFIFFKKQNKIQLKICEIAENFLPKLIEIREQKWL